MRNTSWAVLLIAICLSIGLHVGAMHPMLVLHQGNAPHKVIKTLRMRLLNKQASESPLASLKGSAFPIDSAIKSRPKSVQRTQGINASSDQNSAANTIPPDQQPTPSPADAASEPNALAMLDRLTQQAVAEQSSRQKKQSIFAPAVKNTTYSETATQHERFEARESNMGRVEKVATPLGNYCIHVPNAALSHRQESGVRLATVATCH